MLIILSKINLVKSQESYLQGMIRGGVFCLLPRAHCMLIICRFGESEK